ncbi:AAA family ATPase [Ornithinibacillus sp. L9]|uniref:AAA family ATPase n=1 Tax=Ornithinibacillus caprae TaxID=2678566 RepID=A0A6N8FLK8_9BACI|nr:AAA family ATPase [Ornithinibacillus caprae]MUK88188.1 AAA family ATPase [Ornithinibacillus caprae]
MELIYLWVDNFRNIENMGFNLSSKFNVDFKRQNDESSHPNLIINKNSFHLKLYEKKVNNITGIIGKNGSGKTNILDLLGAKRYDRSSFGNYETQKYFLIYHLEDNLFALEGSNFDYIKNSIENYSTNNSRSHISEPYSIVIEKIGDKFFYRGFLQSSQGRDYKEDINYFSFRYRYSKKTYRHHQSMKIENEPSHLFNRINISPQNTGYSAIFQMINDLNNKTSSNNDNNFMFTFKNEMYLKITPNMYINDEINLEIEKGFEKKIDLLNLGSHKNQTKFNEKQDFINKILYDFCHCLASQFFLLPKMESELSEFITNIKDINVKGDNFYSYYIEIISTLLNYQEEKDKYFQYKEQIIEKLERFINEISGFSKDWFNRENITIPLSEDTKSYRAITNFLFLFDDLNFVDEELQTLTKIFSLEFYPFSAGEEALLSLFSALHYSLSLNYNGTKDKAIILLDEPDNFMHPEWSRLLINELCSYLNRLENGYSSYQIIVTTHSPFIISDLSKDNVIALEKDVATGKCKQVPITTDPFAANIHSLLANDFFMTSTTGEFARNKINKIINLLNASKDLSTKNKEEIDYVISIIGEPLIKSRLELMTEKVVHKDDTIRKLKARIMELEKDDPYKKQ